MKKYPRRVQKQFPPSMQLAPDVYLEMLKETERLYDSGFTYGCVLGRGTDENWLRATIDIGAIRKEIAELEAQLKPTFTLEEILAELE